MGFEQDKEEMTVYIPIGADVKGKNVKVDFHPTRLVVKIKGEEYLSDKFAGSQKADCAECYWEIDNVKDKSNWFRVLAGENEPEPQEEPAATPAADDEKAAEKEGGETEIIRETDESKLAPAERRKLRAIAKMKEQEAEKAAKEAEAEAAAAKEEEEAAAAGNSFFGD